MHDWKRSLSFEYIASEFEDVDEDVFDDLSEIHCYHESNCPPKP